MINSNTGSRPRRRTLYSIAALVLTAPLLLSGCTSAGSPADTPEGQVVAEFFTLLESGKTAGIAALVSDDAGLTPGVLDSDFYAATVARPTDSTVVAAYEFEPGLTYVTVDYLLNGEHRDIKVAVEDSGGTPTISGWLHDGLTVDPLRAPGAFVVNGSLPVGEVETQTAVVALPGIYSVEYVDPQGFGTIDPEGSDTSAFEVEFPIDSEQLADLAVPGLSARLSGIVAEPRLLASVEKELDGQVAELVRSCTNSGLVGADCPPDVVTKASRGGRVDPSSIVWTDSSTQYSRPSTDWDFVADFYLVFSSDSGNTSVDTKFSMVVVADARGNPVLDAAY